MIPFKRRRSTCGWSRFRLPRRWSRAGLRKPHRQGTALFSSDRSHRSQTSTS